MDSSSPPQVEDKVLVDAPTFGSTTSAQVPQTLGVASSLADIKAELEAMGFQTFPAREGLCATRKKFYWECVLVKLTTIVFVREVEHLDEAGLARLREDLIVEARGLDHSSLAEGFQKGTAVVPILMAKSVDPALAERLDKIRSKGGMAKFFFPVVVDSQTGASSYLKHTPLVGGVFYAKFRWLARRLSQPGRSIEAEPLSRLGVAITMMLLIQVGIALTILFGLT